MNEPCVLTSRLVLRRWRASDLPQFASINADERVTHGLLGPFTAQQSAAQINHFEDHFIRHGYGRWAVVKADTRELVGMVGISVVQFEAHFTPAVEVAWRLGHRYWGAGYATEAAQAALDFGFDVVGLSDIVAYTVPGNNRSLEVMKRLGMTQKAEDDFDHPLLPEGHRLQRHVLYRLQACQRTWRPTLPPCRPNSSGDR